MQGRVLSYPVVVTKGEDECYAVGAELRGISQNPEIEFYHERSRKLLVEGYFSPPEACAVSLSSIEFCWAVNHAPYISWQNASLEYPLSMSCNDVILNCEEISQMPKRLILEAFSLSYGFYTIQYGISLNRDPDQGPVIQKCTTGYVTVAPSPLRVVIKGGT